MASKCRSRLVPGVLGHIYRSVRESQTMQAFEKIYSSAMRIAGPAFIQDPLTLDMVVNAPALTRTIVQWRPWREWQRRGRAPGAKTL